MKKNLGAGQQHGKGPGAIGHLGFLDGHLTEEKLKTEKEIFQKINAAGGPTNPMEWFTEQVDTEEDQLYLLVQE